METTTVIEINEAALDGRVREALAFVRTQFAAGDVASTERSVLELIRRDAAPFGEEGSEQIRVTDIPLVYCHASATVPEGVVRVRPIGSILGHLPMSRVRSMAVVQRIEADTTAVFGRGWPRPVSEFNRIEGFLTSDLRERLLRTLESHGLPVERY